MFYEFRNIGDVEYVRVDTENNMNFPKHIHQSFEIMLVTDGELSVTVDRREYTLEEGDAVFVFPNQVHSLRSEKSEHITFVFSPLLVNAYFSKVKDVVPENPVFRPDGYMTKALFSLSPGSPVIQKKGVLYSVCAEFDKGTGYIPPDYKNRHFFEIFSYIENNYTKECSLSEAAKQIGMNYSYISRDFTRLVGMSFNEYVNLMRLNMACHLLKNTEYSITECSLESGFGSTHTFSRIFREHYGITPYKYRKSLKDAEKRQL